MSRKITMRGDRAQYVEMRAQAVPDDGREIVMEGNNVCYKEMAGVATVEEQTIVAAATATTKKVAALPDSLATAAAQIYWQRLKDAGFVDDNCMLLDTTTRQQTWVIAEMFAEKLKLENTKWKLFQDFWKIRNLAQDKKHSQEYGMPIPRLKDIAAVFEQDL